MCVNGAVIYIYIYIHSIDNSFTTQGHMLYMILYNILYTHTYILLCFIMEYTMIPNVEAIEGCVLVIQLSGGIEQHHPQCTDSHTVTCITLYYSSVQLGFICPCMSCRNHQCCGGGVWSHEIMCSIHYKKCGQGSLYRHTVHMLA